MKNNFHKTTTAISRSYLACRNLVKDFRKNVKGVAAIEAAFILPVMGILYIGLVDISTALSVNRKITITTNMMGDLVSQEPGTTTPQNLTGMYTGAIQVMAPYNSAQFVVKVYEYKLDEDDNPVLNWEWESSNASCGIAPTPDAAMKTLMAQGNDVIVTKICHNFHYIIGSLFSSPTIAMEKEMTLRPRKSLHLECSSC